MKNRLGALGTAVVIAGIVSGCGKGRADDPQSASAPVATRQPVSVATVDLRDFQPSLVSTGTLAPERRAELRALVEGKIERLPVDIGTRVRKGQFLFEIRTVDYRIALEQAKAQLTRAQVMLRDSERERDRLVGLVSEGSATEQARDRALADHEQAVAAVQEAEAHRDMAQQALADCTVAAPYDGVITARPMQAGEYARKADAVLEIMDLKTLNAEMEIPERYAGQVTEGTEVRVHIPALSQAVQGQAVAVNPKVDVSNRTFRVKVAVDNSAGRLQAGLFCSATFRLAARRGRPTVPEQAVLRDEGRSTVWIVADGKVHGRSVVEAGAQDGRVFIEEGLVGGEKVVVSGAGGLTEGAEVAVAQ